MVATQIIRIMPNQPTFPFDQLSTELALEIIRLATIPTFDYSSLTPSGRPKNAYRDALSCSLVSSQFRYAALPQLLSTVVLSQAQHVWAFIRAIQIQRLHRKNPNSRLALDYTLYVKNMWCGTCWEPSFDEPEDSPLWLDYAALWEVMRSVENLAIHARSMHLLHRGVATESLFVDSYATYNSPTSPTSPSFEPRCKTLTIVGTGFKWEPLTLSPSGLSFLSKLSKLILWTPDTQSAATCRDSPSPASDIVPSCISHVPFEDMPALQQLGFVVTSSGGSGCRARWSTLAYTLPANKNYHSGLFKHWAIHSPNPTQYGSLVPLCGVEASDIKTWERAWVSGEAQRCFSGAGKLGKGENLKRERCFL